MALTQIQFQRAGQFVRSYLKRTTHNYGHANAEHRAVARWMHTLNVLKNVRMILDGESADANSRDVCEMAALFHDIDHYTVDLQYHALRGAETVTEFLTREGYSEEFVAWVAEAVRGHHHDLDDDLPISEQMDAIAAEQSREANMLMDAETLDKIGASNILQSVLTLGKVNHPHLHDVARELTSGWPLQRAQNWVATLVTPTGRAIGLQRLAFYSQVLHQIEDEIVMNDPFPMPSAMTQETLQVP